MLQSLGLSREFAANVGKAIGTGKTNTANIEALIYSMHVAMDGSQSTGNAGRGNNMASQGFVQRPVEFFQQSLVGNMPPTGKGFGGVSGAAPFGTSQTGRSLQIAMLKDPSFTAALERQLGGSVLPANDEGKVQVFKHNQIRSGAVMREAHKTGAIPKSSLTIALASVNAPLAGPGLNQGQLGGVLKGLAAFEQNIKSFAAGISGAADTMDPRVAAAAKSAGINLQNPSFEESVQLALMSYGVKQETEIGAKIKDLDKSLAGGATGAAAPAGTTNAASGLPSGRQDGVIQGQIQGNGVFGGLVSQAGGTTAKGIVGEVEGAAVPGRPELAQAGATQAGTGVQDPSQLSETMKQQMLQKMMSDLTKMYEMLSNIMKTMHDMMMKPIQALRG